MFREAQSPLRRALELRPTMSKAYQLLGEAHEKLGERAEAVKIVTKGVSVADELGDVMPRDTMVGLLRAWGAPVPALKASTKPVATTTEGAAEASDFRCSRCGKPGGGLPKPPFKGALGERIHRQICSSCWREWIGMGTKVINELGLQLNTKHGQDTYDQYLVEFLQLEEA
jgi:Fe-S cluster biosynthesis and repair protein YggX